MITVVRLKKKSSSKLIHIPLVFWCIVSQCTIYLYKYVQRIPFVLLAIALDQVTVEKARLWLERLKFMYNYWFIWVVFAVLHAFTWWLRHLIFGVYIHKNYNFFFLFSYLLSFHSFYGCCGCCSTLHFSFRSKSWEKLN